MTWDQFQGVHLFKGSKVGLVVMSRAFHLYNLGSISGPPILGESGWCSGYQLCLPPLRPGIDFQASHMGLDL